METKRLWIIVFVIMLVSCTPATTVVFPTETLISSITFTSVPPTTTSEPTSTHSMSIEPGTYLVGTEIDPGIYRGQSEGDLPKGICGWTRLKDISGNIDAILGSNTAHGQFYVEIKDSDYAFKTTCKLIPLDSLPNVTQSFPAKFEYGMYLVGRDINAGIYRGIPKDGAKAPCFWERLQNVAGSWDGVIANGHETKEFYVEILKSDFAFITTCELMIVGY